MKKTILILTLQFIAFATFGQFSIKGIITGNGEPLAGASVLIKNTYIGASTGSKGDFEFRNLREGNYTLIISFIGYETSESMIKLVENQEFRLDLRPQSLMTDEVLITATRAKDKTPVAFTNVSNEQIARRNLGQDIPYLLSLTPSFVATSDAGTGIGYTNFRIRGTDLNRINVSINGIPLNDAESHGTWFVDQPDLASSLENVQIQRGVGSSSNGAAAFGATINLQTNNLRKKPYAEIKSSYGSFNTFKNTLITGTGLIDGKFALDARFSKVKSDGYIDRAFSDLNSFFISAGYFTETTILKLNLFSGSEETYQAWWGVPSVRLKNDLEGMKLYEEHGLYTHEQTDEMIQSDNRTYNYYTWENQIDHYQQDHYHLHFSHKFNPQVYVNGALYYIHGRGYYENFEKDQDFADYRMTYPVINGQTIESADLVNRKWLNNDFYGFLFSFNYLKGAGDLTFGGGFNMYDGRHYGNVIWAQYLGNNKFNHEWYSGTGLKKDGNLFARYNLKASEIINLYADLQYRYIHYKIAGIDDNLRDVSQTHEFHFFNPKLGVLYNPSPSHQAYLSFATAHREPNRSNYTDADPSKKQPVHETLRDWESGYTFRSPDLMAGINLFLMDYDNQLVLTGEINDVGAPIMENVNKSYRMGIELQSGLRILPKLQYDLNLTLSRNKIRNFTEYVDNWDTGIQEKLQSGKTDLSFSPGMTLNGQLIFKPAENLELCFISYYVGKQFIDNSSGNDRILDSYFVNNLETRYTVKTKLFSKLQFHLNIMNLFNEIYESNAWVYSYIYGGKRNKMDGYFPQAGTNFLFGIDFNF